MSNNREQCPRCGGLAVVMEGDFVMRNDAVEVLTASPMTWRMLQRLQAIAEAATDGKISVDAAVAQVADEAPWLARHLEALSSPKARLWFLNFLATVLTIIAAQALAEVRDVSLDATQLRQITGDEIRRAVSDAERRGVAFVPKASWHPPLPPRKLIAQKKKASKRGKGKSRQRR